MSTTFINAQKKKRKKKKRKKEAHLENINI